MPSVPTSLRRITRAACALAALGCAARTLSAQVIPPAPMAAPEAAAAGAPAAPASLWLFGGIARTVVGYTDNVLWSAVENRGRGFGQAELEAYLIRPRHRGWEAKAMLSGEVRRYHEPLPEAAGEQRWVGRGEFAVVPRPWLRVALVPQAYYMDQVYDLSPDTGRRFVAKLRVKGAGGAAQTTIALPRGWEIEPAVQTRVSDYLDFTEDYSETRTGVRLRWRQRASFEATAAIFDLRRDYRERVNTTAGGRPLPGTDLRFHQTSAEAGLAWTSAARGRWRVAPALVYLENRDGASGFFDYDQRRARCDVTWEAGRWRVDLEASAGRYDYRVQTVGMGLNPPARLREDFLAAVNLERALTARWSALARFAWERSRTNEINASYRIHTVSAGVVWNR